MRGGEKPSTVPKRAASTDRNGHPARDLPRIEAELAHLRATAVAAAPKNRFKPAAAEWQTRVDLTLLDAILAAFLRAAGGKSSGRRSADLLGLRSLVESAAGAPFAAGSAERAAL